MLATSLDIHNKKCLIINERVKQRIVILGAGGFLGRAMANHLASLGKSVVAGLFEESEDLPNAECVYGDVNDSDFLNRILPDADIVYHFASSTIPQTHKDCFTDELEQTLVPLMRIIAISRENGVGRIVFPSSGGTVYVNDSERCDEDSPLLGTSPYANCKIMSEFILRHATESGDLAATIFRIGNPFGPGQIAKPGIGVIAHWVDAIKQKKPITVYGNEEVSRDFVFIDDVCKLMEIEETMNNPFDVFNVGSGRATSLKQIYQALGSELGEEIAIVKQCSRSTDRDSICLNVDKLLKHKPHFEFTSLNAGLRKTLASSGLIDIS